jgi:hypothetical protein
MEGFLFTHLQQQKRSREAGNVVAAQEGFNGNEVLSWQCSGPMGVYRSFLEFTSSFSVGTL